MPYEFSEPKVVENPIRYTGCRIVEIRINLRKDDLKTDHATFMLELTGKKTVTDQETGEKREEDVKHEVFFKDALQILAQSQPNEFKIAYLALKRFGYTEAKIRKLVPGGMIT